MKAKKKHPKYTGRCLCGKISYEIEGEIGPIYNCHCSKCRRWHGSACRTRASVRSKDFKWTSGEALLSRFHSSDTVVKTFCSVCGSNLISILEDNPDFIGLPLGGLEQDPGHKPKGHLFVGSKAPWHEITDDLPQYEAWPPGAEEAVRGKKPE